VTYKKDWLDPFVYSSEILLSKYAMQAGVPDNDNGIEDMTEPLVLSILSINEGNGRNPKSSDVNDFSDIDTYRPLEKIFVAEPDR
jgi:hypothetical protein